jgi:hypothetical protein
MIIRFVEGSELVSKLIIAQEKTAMPFTPSHVEAVTPDGFYLGAHFDGGVLKRPKDYDKGQFSNELILPIQATPEEDLKFYKYLEDHIGEPYDWKAIIGFVIPEHEHLLDHTICSALISMAFRVSNWFAFKLATPAHLIDPRDLLLMLSSRMEIPM